MTGWLINKFFQGREQIKAKMAALFESGILYKLEKAEYQEYKERNPVRRVFDVKNSTMSLTVEDIQGILAILFVGYFFSTPCSLIIDTKVSCYCVSGLDLKQDCLYGLVLSMVIIFKYHFHKLSNVLKQILAIYS